MGDLIERLRALHVWPQSTADEYADTLTPRRIAALYEVGKVAHEAAEALTTAQAEIEALKAERDKLAGIVQGWHYLAVGPDEMGDYYTHKQLVKASEPYASPTLRAIEARQQ